MPNAVQLPDCCGIIVINQFKGGHPGADPDACIGKKDLDDYLSQQEKQYYGNRAGLLVVLSRPQNDRIGEVFVRRKWQVLLKGTKNGRTGQPLFMYFRDLNPTEARHRRIFGS